MRRSILAAAAVVLLVGCGSDDSTGPVNPNPNAKNYTITVKADAFDPSSLTVLIGDTVTWVVEDGAGNHAVTFYDLPPSATVDSTSGPMSDTGAPPTKKSVFTVFLKAGTYSFRDDSTDATGTLVVNELP